jgi:UDP-3-O-[3-hydroxymyristoyl] glucosamine N-acyltransferase
MITLSKILHEISKLNDFESIENFKLTNLEFGVEPKKYTDPDISLNSLIWLKNENLDKIKDISKSNIIVHYDFDVKNLKNDFTGSVIKTKNPRRLFNHIVKTFFIKNKFFKYSNHPQNIKIGLGSIIEDGVIIGSGTTIGYNNVIKYGTIIGSNVIIGSNNTIGEVGFGYQKDENGEYLQIEHIGGVIIEDFVEIGNNTCIDKAVLGNTIIKKNSKIDNLVHIAHGVEIGENTLIIANSMIAGSTCIGKNTWIAPSTSVINNIKIGSNSMSGMGSVITKNVDDNSLVVGIPAKKIKEI